MKFGEWNTILTLQCWSNKKVFGWNYGLNKCYHCYYITIKKLNSAIQYYVFLKIMQIRDIRIPFLVDRIIFCLNSSRGSWWIKALTLPTLHYWAVCSESAQNRGTALQMKILLNASQGKDSSKKQRIKYMYYYKVTVQVFYLKRKVFWIFICIHAHSVENEQSTVRAQYNEMTKRQRQIPQV